MSQVKFKAVTESGPVEVMGGWDRPLSEFYMTIFDLATDAEDETVWASMFGPSPKTTAPLRAQLVQMGIEAPEEFWDRVERREANVTHVYADGKWTRDEF